MGVETTTLFINGEKRTFSMGDHFGQVPYSETLLETLRDRLGLTAAKKSCGEGACGCCTVIKDGDAVPFLHAADRGLRRRAHYDTGRPGRPRDRRAQPGPAGISGLQRFPVRLLHARHHHEHPGSSEQEPAPDAGGGSRCTERKLLPLHQHYHVFEAIDSLAGRRVDLDEKWRNRR